MTIQDPPLPAATRRRAGRAAERETRRHLDERFGPSPDHAVLHDIRIDPGDGHVAQIDHLVLNRFAEAWVIETKSAVGGLGVDRDGQWTRRDRAGHVPIPSPVRQAERQAGAIGRLDHDRRLPLPSRIRLTGGLHVRALVVAADGTPVARPDDPPEAVCREVGRVVRCDEIGTRMWDDGQYPVQLEGIPEARNWTRALLAPLRLIGREALVRLADAIASHALPRRGPCASCGCAVTEGVEAFCRARPERFGERVYCMPCQQARLASTSVAIPAERR